MVAKSAETEAQPQAKTRGTKRLRPRVVVVGAGFGGLNAVMALSGEEVDVLLLDRNNYHGFWPLLYQVATAGLDAESIAYPVRPILHKYPNADFEMVTVQSVDFANHRVITDRLPIEYDYLVLAAGSANNYFGNDMLAGQTTGLKDLPDAVQLRENILTCFETAVREPDPDKRAKLMTFVIVGGGPTGVELSGAFAELIGHVLRRDYPMLDVSMARIILLEGSPHLLAAFPPKLQKEALKRLTRRGVDVHLQTMVTRVEDGTVTLKDGTQIVAGTVVWAAGVRAAALSDTLGLALERGAHVPVMPTLNLADHPDVFVIGDMAWLKGYKGDKPYPMVAQVAIQQGKQAGKNILAAVRGTPMRPFHYADKGNLATIGRASAVFDAFGIQMSGFIAWLGWLFIHLIYLIGFRNRLVVLANWAYNYLTYDNNVRIIIRHTMPAMLKDEAASKADS